MCENKNKQCDECGKEGNWIEVRKGIYICDDCLRANEKQDN